MMKLARCLLFASLLLLPARIFAGPVVYIDDVNDELGTVDVATGAVTDIGPLGVDITDIAFAPNGTLYGISFASLYRINAATGATVLIGSHGIDGANALVFGADGTLYAASATSTELYTINPSTGGSTDLGDIGFESGGDLAFNGGNLYMSSADGDLIEISISSYFYSGYTYVSGMDIGSTGFQNVDGLATGSDGVLYGVSGTEIFSVNTSTGAGTLVSDYGGGVLGAGLGTSFITETDPTITSALTDNAQAGQPYSYQITSDPAAKSYAVTGLTSGLSLNNTTGVISGTPTVAGTFPIQLQVNDAAGGSTTATLNLTIAPAVAPILTGTPSTAGKVGSFYYFQITAANTPTSYAASGLPPGFTFYPSLGVISGIPTQAGAYSIAYSASNSGGTSAGVLNLTVAAAPVLPVITLSADIAQVTAGTGEYGEFVINRTGGDLSQQLLINYAVSGTGIAKQDYVKLKGVKKLKANKASAKIRVIPLGDGAGSGEVRTVTLSLAAGDGYTIGASTKVKVKIYGQ
jgi:hypothetical protein